MANTPETPQDTSWKPQPLFAGFLSYLVPGLGQIVQGRIAKGVMFMVILLSMFIGGQYLGGWRTVYITRDTNDNKLWIWNLSPGLITNVVCHRWHYAGQFGIGVAAWPAIFQYERCPKDDKAIEPRGFWNTFQRAPSEKNLNDYLRAHGKMPELAWVYTVIAGMLNILVIFDAFAGPAHGSAKEPKT